MTPGLRRRILLAGAAAGASRLAAGAVRRHHPGGADLWQRTNYRQRQVELVGGPGATAGLLGALTLARAPRATFLIAASSALGLYDDLAGHTHARGLRGHAAALRSGVITSGMVKMVGLAAAAAASAPSQPRRVVGTGVDVVLIAGSANLVNLLDLRPGRALKVVTAVGLPLVAADGVAGDVAATAVGASLAMLPADLTERQMLGDCGANALGAVIGWSLAARLHGRARLLAAATIVGLTITSERVSFSSLIERQPVLAALDQWGRRAP